MTRIHRLRRFKDSSEEEEEGTRVPSPEEEPETTPKVGGGGSASRQSENGSAKPKKSRLFVKRDKKFLRISEVNDLQVGEDVYRKRPRSFGVAEAYIKHCKYQIK